MAAIDQQLTFARSDLRNIRRGLSLFTFAIKTQLVLGVRFAELRALTKDVLQGYNGLAVVDDLTCAAS